MLLVHGLLDSADDDIVNLLVLQVAVEFLLLLDQGVKFIFDRVLVSAVAQPLHQVRPLLAFLPHELEHYQALVHFPVALDLLGVQVVVPVLPALLGRPEVFFIRQVEQLLGDLIPLDFVSVASHYILQ